jgi:hypothetical protein
MREKGHRYQRCSERIGAEDETVASEGYNGEQNLLANVVVVVEDVQLCFAQQPKSRFKTTWTPHQQQQREKALLETPVSLLFWAPAVLFSGEWRPSGNRIASVHRRSGGNWRAEKRNEFGSSHWLKWVL